MSKPGIKVRRIDVGKVRHEIGEHGYGDISMRFAEECQRIISDAFDEDNVWRLFSDIRECHNLGPEISTYGIIAKFTKAEIVKGEHKSHLTRIGRGAARTITAEVAKALGLTEPLLCSEKSNHPRAEVLLLAGEAAPRVVVTEEGDRFVVRCFHDFGVTALARNA